jgi:hypothetical protein
MDEHDYETLVSLYEDMIRAETPVECPILVRGADGRFTPLEEVSRAKVEAALRCNINVEACVIEEADPEKLDRLREQLEADRREEAEAKAAGEEYRPGSGKIRARIFDHETGGAFVGWIDPSNTGKGRVRQETFDPALLDIIAWTHAVVGRYWPSGRTLEEWEIGFMRDLHPGGEVLFSLRVAFAFITYHRRTGLLPQNFDTEAELVRRLVGYTQWGPIDFAEACGSAEEEALVHECMEHPDGWEEEQARTVAATREAGRWTPPPSMADWPPSD